MLPPTKNLCQQTSHIYEQKETKTGPPNNKTTEAVTAVSKKAHPLLNSNIYVWGYKKIWSLFNKHLAELQKQCVWKT